MKNILVQVITADDPSYLCFYPSIEDIDVPVAKQAVENLLNEIPGPVGNLMVSYFEKGLNAEKEWNIWGYDAGCLFDGTDLPCPFTVEHVINYHC